jgi:hypothetical protein
MAEVDRLQAAAATMAADDVAWHMDGPKFLLDSLWSA